jgi:hypothetical protein
VLAVQHGAGERFRAEARELGGQHEREKGRVAARGARRDVERVVAELALDVLGEPAADPLDTLCRAHRLHDPRGGGRPVAFARLRSADHDDRSGSGQEIAGALLLRSARVERRGVGDAADRRAALEGDRLQLRRGAER